MVACGGSSKPAAQKAVSDMPAAAPSTTAATTTVPLVVPSTTTTTAPPVIAPPVGPGLPAAPAALADALVAAEQVIRDPARTSAALDDAAHLEQLAYRR